MLREPITAWIKQDSAAALAWIQAHDVPGVATAGYSGQGTLLAAIAREEPQTAIAEWSALRDPKARAATLDSVVSSWGLNDPVAAIRWAEEQSRSLGVTANPQPGVLSAWARTEPEAALRWIEGWLAKQPKTTADLYAKIKDPGLRAATLAKHLAEWRTKDPAAADSWLKSQTALPASETSALSAPAK